MIRAIHGGITAPAGFKANGIVCGIKKSKKKDLALIVADRLCTAAGTFTSNKVQASCVRFNKEQIRDGHAQAIVVNSGNANCMTGASGAANTKKMASLAAKALRLNPKNVLVGSTGVIGVPLPIAKIVKGLPHLVKGLSKHGSIEAAHAILTTDRVPKEVALEFKIGSKTVRLGAIAKGAGMIHPHMILSDQKHATMLCYITTDAVIGAHALRLALGKAVSKTFNMISIDADMSTNDMAVVLASGAAGNHAIRENTKEFRLFTRALETACGALGKMMVKDAEGATKFVEVAIKHAQTQEDARIAARSVTSSKLVKCALFGSDPNWGRIAAAVGYSGAHVDPDRMSIHLGPHVVVRNGARVSQNASALHKTFSRKNIKITVDLGLGKYQASAWTCDLSTGYVRINSAYRT